jgi:hypothetical protein
MVRGIGRNLRLGLGFVKGGNPSLRTHLQACQRESILVGPPLS